MPVPLLLLLLPPLLLLLLLFLPLLLRMLPCDVTGGLDRRVSAVTGMARSGLGD